MFSVTEKMCQILLDALYSLRVLNLWRLQKCSWRLFISLMKYTTLVYVNLIIKYCTNEGLTNVPFDSNRSLPFLKNIQPANTDFKKLTYHLKVDHVVLMRSIICNGFQGEQGLL